MIWFHFINQALIIMPCFLLLIPLMYINDSNSGKILLISINVLNKIIQIYKLACEKIPENSAIHAGQSNYTVISLWTIASSVSIKKSLPLSLIQYEPFYIYDSRSPYIFMQTNEKSYTEPSVQFCQYIADFYFFGIPLVFLFVLCIYRGISSRNVLILTWIFSILS